MAKDAPGVEAEALHESLLAGARDGLEQAFTLFHRPIISSLASRPRYRKLDPQAVEDAAIDALLEYFENPREFDPSRGRPLQSYLEFAAERNLLNTLRSESRLRGRETKAVTKSAKSATDSVELSSPAGNLIQSEADDALAREYERVLALLPDATDRKVFELRGAGERKTAAFAAVLGLAHLPADEQRRAVKKTKDRIDKVLTRGLRDRKDRRQEHEASDG